MAVVIEALAEREAQAPDAPDVVPHREVVPLDVRGARPGVLGERPGITRDELAVAVAKGSHNALSGFMRSIAAQTEANRLKKTAVYKKTEEGEGRARVYRYHPGILLAEKGGKEAKETKG